MNISDQLIASVPAPNWLYRHFIQRGLGNMITQKGQVYSSQDYLESYLHNLRSVPIATHTDTANVQHYEVPAEFFKVVLGDHLKYSSGYWDESTKTLTEAELKMLEISFENAELSDGQDILELGCGWGSFTMYMAERLPLSKIVAVSNSRDQRAYIESQLKERGLGNVEVVTCDVQNFVPTHSFDRIVSIEMFEHLKNYELLFQKLKSWLNDGGVVFAHIFTHETMCYAFEQDDPNSWMARNFFSGGQMPSKNLFTYFDRDLYVSRVWHYNGKHYHKTCEAWLTNLETNIPRLLTILKESPHHFKPTQQLRMWRLFFLICSELFRYNDGKEWSVRHYLLKPTPNKHEEDL